MSKLCSWVVLGMLALPALSGCGPAGVPAGAQRLASSAVQEFVHTEAYTGVSDRRRVVLRTQEEWQTFWAELYRQRSEPPALPAVNFANEMVLVASAGQKASGGYTIDVRELYTHADELFAIVLETSPGSGCVLTTALTAPVVVMRVPRSDGPVHFIDETAVHDCE